MIRHNIKCRDNWQKKVEEKGLYFHTPDEQTYWDESVCYEFTEKEILKIEKATNSLHEMCIEAVESILKYNWFSKLGISFVQEKLIRDSWELDQRSLYGRFDLCVTPSGEIKMLEYNADTPTSLLEAAVTQWYWLQDCFPKEDQFNSLHERLIQRIAEIANKKQLLYFSSMRQSAEDITLTEYLRDVAHQAKFKTQQIFIDEIGYNNNTKQFVDLEELEIKQIFKLYPWEWLLKDEFGIRIDLKNCFWMEPAWKSILSNKAILAILWEMFPNHELLLETHFHEPKYDSWVQKPFCSREGQHIQVRQNGSVIIDTGGVKESAQYVYQKYFELPKFEGNYPVIGSWIIGEEAGGMGIREDKTPITGNLSRFVPHYFVKGR